MNFQSRITISLLLFMLFALPASADEKRIYQTDSLGNIQYNKTLHTIQKDGRIVETDAIGNKQYHKPQYQIKGDKVFQVDSQGNIQHHKPQFQIK